MNYWPLVAFVGAAVILFAFNQRNKGKDGEEDRKQKAGKENKYKEQGVKFVKTDKSYVETLKKELEEDRPHFDTLRKEASSNVSGTDFLGIEIEKQTWLFPVSQKHLKDLYSMSNLGGKLETIPFSMAVGYAPDGMPFIHTNEHWKELRKNVAAIFHNDFMETYMQIFNNCVKDLAKKWKESSGTTLNVKEDICNMAYDSAMYCLIGDKLDVEIPYTDGNEAKNIHIRDVNTKILSEFTKHAATKEFVENNDYRSTSGSKRVNALNQNMGTFAGAFKGLVEARVAEIQNGAPAKTTIVDAAISLTLKGIVKSVDEAIQHGWAILNGAHSNCGNALAATLYYLMKNPAAYKKLKAEIETQLLKDGTWNEDNLHEVTTRENLKEMEYLGYVVKEALRLSSPIYGKPMRATEDVKLEDFVIEKDTIVYPNNGVLGVSENIWQEPTKFIPERFDPESKYYKLPNGQKREPITWLAFGAGPRVCMGDNFSMYFIKVGLVYFLHLFDFELKKEPEVDSFFYWLNDREYTASVTAH